MSAVIVALNKSGVADRRRLAFYKEIIPVFEDQDWDTPDECEGEDPTFDAAMRELQPEWYEE
jgi:hypothetical protein